MVLILFLVTASLVLFLLAFIFIMLDVLKTKKKSISGKYKKEGLSKSSGYSYGLGFLAMLILMFVGAMLV